MCGNTLDFKGFSIDEKCKKFRLKTKEKSVKTLKIQRFYAFLHHGEHGIRTHAPVTRPNAFRVRPLEPLG